MESQNSADRGLVEYRPSRKKNGLAGAFFAVILISFEVSMISDHGDPVAGLMVLALLGPFTYFFAKALFQDEADLTFDSVGLFARRSGVSLRWAETENLHVREYQTQFGLNHELIIRATSAPLLESRWNAPRKWWNAEPKDGEFTVALDLLSPDWESVSPNIERLSGQAVETTLVRKKKDKRRARAT